MTVLSCEKQATEESSQPEFCIPDAWMKNITLDSVKAEPVMSELKFSGKIAFNENAVVSVFSVMGGNVTDVKVSLGDYVEKGQLLASLRSSDMASVYGDLKAAESQLLIAKKNLDVTTELKNSGVSSERDYISAVSDYQKAQAQYNRALETNKIYGSTTPADSAGSTYQLRAPISGFVVARNINPGMEVRPDDNTAIFTISDLKEVWAIANIFETDISKIHEGTNVNVSTLSYPEKIFAGKVEQISNVINPETNALTVKIKLKNDDYLLKPGMFANVSMFFPETENVLSVPVKAVMFDENKTYVVQFRKRCDLNIRPVTIVNKFNDKYYIREDSMQVNDLVIDQNALFVFTALKKL